MFLLKIFKNILKGLGFIILTLIFIVGGLGLGVVIFGGDLFLQYQKTTPQFEIKQLENPEPSKFVDLNGELLATVGTEYRNEIKMSEVPIEFVEALVSTEDSRFFKHSGLDIKRTIKAGLVNVTDGFGSQGGSTLTQQLVKLTFLDQNESSLKRKTQELTLAWKLEKLFTKEEILELYINKIYMGEGVYGVGTASEYYYGKPMQELTVPQLALLAGIPNAPEAFNPYASPEKAKKRRDIVLYRMHVTEAITDEEYEKYLNTPILEGIVPKEEQPEKDLNTIPKEYRMYVEQAIEEVKQIFDKDAYKDGLTITLGIDKKLQNFSNELTMTNNIIAYPNSDMMINFTILDNTTGRVLANGSGNRETEIGYGNFNFATQSMKQAGSTMKPFLSYAPSIEYLGLTSSSITSDSPYKYADGTTLNNWDYKYQGNITLSQALAGSRNIPAVRLYNQVGWNKAVEFANKLGLEIASDDVVESAPLGSVSNQNPYKMANAYSTFARNGNFVKAHTIVDVKDKQGNELFKESSGEQVMSETTALEVTKMLEETVTKSYGTAYSCINNIGRNIAMKTGTTNYAEYEDNYNLGLVPDAWVVGYTKEYTVAIWQGYDKRSKGVVNYTETALAYDTFNKIMQQLY